MLEKCVDAVWQCVSAISSYFSANFWSVDVVLLELCKKTKKKIHYIFLAVQDSSIGDLVTH